MRLWSATRTVHVRAPPPFASTDRRIVPAPFPLAPETTWTQTSSTAAVHEQPVSVSSANVTVPPAAETDEFSGETSNLHGAGSCETPIGVPLTSSVARRDAGCPFASTR